MEEVEGGRYEIRERKFSGEGINTSREHWMKNVDWRGKTGK